MKIRNINFLVVIVLSIVTLGCSDILEEDAKGLLTPDQFFTNQDEANLALNGLQARLKTDEVTGQFMLFYQFLGTDEGVVARDGIPANTTVGTYDFNTSNSEVSGIWQQLYAGVRDANLVLARVAQSTSLSEDEKSATIAQALFYRAHFYYRLTTIYGDVPYWRDEIDIDAVSLLGKTSAVTIQTEMVADLEEAIGSGKLSTGRWNQSGGRVTVWAARMMKAHYHMWMQQYDKARTELIEITQNSPHGPELGPYGEIYREGNDLHNEIIFGVEYLVGVASSNIHNGAHPNGGSEGGGSSPAGKAFSELGIWTRAGTVTLRKGLADSYSADDIRLAYNVFDSHTLEDGTFAQFNHIYIPKFMRAKVPVADPLFVNPEANGQSGAPNRLMLLADAYLMLAEAEFMLGGSSEASLAAINKVRQRANVPALTTITLKDIQNERRWELAGEGFGRKTDLIRWGLLEETVLALPAIEIAAGANQQSIDRAQAAANIIAGAPEGKYQFLPIPFDEITKSKDLGGKLEQNPLWQ